MRLFRLFIFYLSFLVFPLLTYSTEVIKITQPTDFWPKVIEPYKIYEIQCEIDLNNDTIFLSDKSVLRFIGGKIKNGTLVGNHTMIDNSTNLPIFEAIEIGSAPYQFINDAIYVDWFTGDSDADRTQAAINFAKKNRNAINFLSREYVFDHTVIVPIGNIVLRGTGGGGEYQDLGTKIVSSRVFSSNYEGSPLFCVCGESPKQEQSLGLVSGHITGITFATNREHDVFQFLLAGAPSRPLVIDFCHFKKCKAAIRLLDNGKSTELGFLYVEHCTMTGNKWNIVAHGRHSMLGLYFCKNVAEQCDGNINLGYTETFTKKPYDVFAPKPQDYAASANIVICDNLLEGTVDCIYVNGGKCVVDIERNYFETSRRQFVVLSFSNPYSTVTFQNNYISKADDVYLQLRNCKYSVQKTLSDIYLNENNATPICN